MRRAMTPYFTLGVCTLVFMLASILQAPAQRLAAVLSANTISVDSTFSGETLTLFGNIEPEIGSSEALQDGRYDVIILVRGPALDRVARRKTGDLGIWLNTEQVLFESFPSFFWVIASNQLSDVADAAVLEDHGLIPQTQPSRVFSQGNGERDLMGAQLVRLMEEDGLYGVREHGIVFRSKTLYSTSLSLPANVPNGDFLAHTFLFHNGQVVAEKAQGFSVRKTGFERLVGSSAKSMPFVYGFICVVLAVFTGWLGGVVFRR